MKKVIALLMCFMLVCVTAYPVFAETSPTASVVTDPDYGKKPVCPICGGDDCEWDDEEHRWVCPDCHWPEEGCPNCHGELEGPDYTHCNHCGWDAEKNPISPQTSTQGFDSNMIFVLSAMGLLVLVATYAGIKSFKATKND